PRPLCENTFALQNPSIFPFHSVENETGRGETAVRFVAQTARLLREFPFTAASVAAHIMEHHDRPTPITDWLEEMGSGSLAWDDFRALDVGPRGNPAGRGWLVVESCSRALAAANHEAALLPIEGGRLIRAQIWPRIRLVRSPELPQTLETEAFDQWR